MTTMSALSSRALFGRRVLSRKEQWHCCGSWEMGARALVEQGDIQCFWVLIIVDALLRLSDPALGPPDVITRGPRCT